MALDDDNGLPFNQFEENKKKFGIKSTYDWNLYSTKIDRDRIEPQTRKIAEQVEKENEKKPKKEIEENEEGLWSNVVREDPQTASFTESPHNHLKGL